MKKLKLGTRVLVNRVETFIVELHAAMQRRVYKVRTSNPTYEFCKHPATGDWFTYACTDGNMIKDCIILEKAPKYGNYQVGEMVKAQGKKATSACPDYKLFLKESIIN
jgi:hypothetical protein